MLRIAIPFSGDPQLFKYGSSPYNSPIPGEVEEGLLILTYKAENPDIGRVKQDFEHRITQIESTLNMISSTANEWNSQLPGIVSTRLQERRAKVERDQTLSLGYTRTTSENENETVRRMVEPSDQVRVRQRSTAIQSYDLFLSHAHEDKEAVARPLYAALTAEGISVWFDEAVLRMGDSLRRKIDEGLVRCRYGVVILSPRFLSKQWPQRELDGLVARETASGEKAILPIWHELDRDTLMRYSPPLADRLAGRSQNGIPSLVSMILDVVG